MYLLHLSNGVLIPRAVILSPILTAYFLYVHGRHGFEILSNCHFVNHILSFGAEQGGEAWKW